MARMGDYGVIDYTPLMELKPRSQNLLEELGIFSEATTEYLDSEYAEFEREEKGYTGMHNVSRGADRQFAGTEQARKEVFIVPFATLDTITKPQEVNAFREYGTENTPASIERLVEKKIEHVQRSHARYIRDVQYEALVNNRVYAYDKDGNQLTSLAKNYSTVWGAARNTGSFDLKNAAVDPFVGISAGRTNIIQNAGDDGDNYEVLLLVNTTAFDLIISHPLVQAAYENYPSEQEPLRRRLSGNRNNRTFRHKGVVVVEDISGKIVDTKGYMLPMNFDGLTSAAYAPADTVEHVNTISQGSYLFMVENRRSTVIESEVSYMVAIQRPELITEFTITVA